MKKLLLPFLALALLAFKSPLAKAEDESSTQPVIVVTFSGYAELKRDLEYLGTLSGNPDMAKGLEQLLMLFTQNQGLAGLDKGRPWGASVSITADGSQFPAMAFLPVTDLKQLLDALAAIIGEADDAGDDIFKIKRGTTTLFIKQEGKWAYIAQQRNVLDELPSNPLKGFRGLDKEYDLAVSVHVQSIPQALRDMAADLIKQGLEAQLQQSQGDDEQAELKAQITRKQVEAMVKGINEIDEITIGLNIDREKSRTYLDIAATAVEGSETAKQMAASAEEAEESRMAAFMLPEAILSLHLNAPISDDDEEQTEAMLKGVIGQIENEIDKEDDLNDDQKQKAKELIGDLFEVLDETMEEEGRLNAGVAIVGEKPFTAVVGVLVADGEELEKIAKKFASLAAEDADLPKPKFNVEKYKGHRFHAMSVPVDNDADNADDLKESLGDPIKVVMAAGEDTFYVAIGEAGLATIKQILDTSAKNGDDDEDEGPLKITLALAPILKLAASKNNDPTQAMMAESLKGGKDHVSITLENIENGVRYRIIAEEGVNRLLGNSLGMGLRAGGAGGR